MNRVLFCAFAIAVGFGCGAKKDDAPSGNPTAGQICPLSIQDASGKACTEEKLVCPMTISCGSFLPQQARCICQEGAFHCFDSLDRATETDPPCSSLGVGHDSECPPSFSPGAACQIAGLSCFYPGPKCGAKFISINADCVCAGDTDDKGNPVLRMRCESGNCVQL